jgi:Ca-activated chloride channel family protein
MITFEYPWIFLILPLPFILRLMLKPKSEDTSAALLTPMYSHWRNIGNNNEQHSIIKSLYLLASLSWVFLVIAAANPLWLDEPVSQIREGRDLMLAVDISGSMDTRDMIIENKEYPRLSVTKSVLDGFIKRRKNDQLGLILFGQQAFLQTPLTFDHKTISQMLNEAVIGLAGAQRTAVGDAIGLAVKRLKKRNTKNKVLVLLTDGANNTGVDPIKASELAALAEIKIYTIGVGADQLEVDGFFGKRVVNPSQDLDEKSLRKIAENTSGKYFRARNPKELVEIYKILDKLEPNEIEAEMIRPQKSLFFLPLFVSAFGFILLLFLLSIRSRVLIKREAKRDAL